MSISQRRNLNIDKTCGLFCNFKHNIKRSLVLGTTSKTKCAAIMSFYFHIYIYVIVFNKPIVVKHADIISAGTAVDGAVCSAPWRVSWRRSRSNVRSASSTPSGGSRPGDPTPYTPRYVSSGRSYKNLSFEIFLNFCNSLLLIFKKLLPDAKIINGE